MTSCSCGSWKEVLQSKRKEGLDGPAPAKPKLGKLEATAPKVVESGDGDGVDDGNDTEKE